MKNYLSLAVSSDAYDRIKATQIKNNTDWKEHIHGSRRKLFVHRKLIATTMVNANLELGELTQQQFVSFLGLFNKHLYSQFHRNPDLFNLKIDFAGVAREKNAEVWHLLKDGTYFYNVDLSSAYWQIAHKLGYISTKFFEEYQNVGSYKQAKRYCISFLARTNKVNIRNNGQEYEIGCDTRVLQRVYDNIRNDLYGCVRGSINGVSDWLEYNIDGVTVMNDNLDAVCRKFKDMGLAFKITECRKVSGTQYIYGSTLRNFIGRNLKTEAI